MTIKPALTAEEWEALQVGNALTGGYSLDYDVTLTSHPDGRGEMLGRESRHKDLDAQGAAAALLYGQPFGFTRADVNALRGLAMIVGEPNNWTPLADRIEALLPPEG